MNKKLIVKNSRLAFAKPHFNLFKFYCICQSTQKFMFTAVGTLAAGLHFPAPS